MHVRYRRDETELAWLRTSEKYLDMPACKYRSISIFNGAIFKALYVRYGIRAVYRNFHRWSYHNANTISERSM